MWGWMRMHSCCKLSHHHTLSPPCVGMDIAQLPTAIAQMWALCIPLWTQRGCLRTHWVARSHRSASVLTPKQCSGAKGTTGEATRGNWLWLVGPGLQVLDSRPWTPGPGLQALECIPGPGVLALECSPGQTTPLPVSPCSTREMGKGPVALGEDGLPRGAPGTGGATTAARQTLNPTSP